MSKEDNEIVISQEHLEELVAIQADYYTLINALKMVETNNHFFGAEDAHSLLKLIGEEALD